MQKTNRSIAAILLLSSLLLTLSAWHLEPISQANGVPDLYLHSEKPLVPVHMHGPSLTPIHMHCRNGTINLSNPWDTYWHELYPEFCPEYQFTSWEDYNGILDTSDQIDMTNVETEEIRWYHVDRVTMTMRVSTGVPVPEPIMYIEYKGPYEPKLYQPVSTLWHEVWPTYSNVYHIVYWMDNGNGYLDVCDNVEFEGFPGILWHVDEYATDLILNEKIMDPIGIEWHEVYPNYCRYYNLTSWEEPFKDPYPRRLSPGDQIDMTDRSGIVTWYHVDRVTLTLNITIIGNGEPYLFEYKGPFEDMYLVKTNPVCTYWHMVWPYYSGEGALHIEDWEDNCNGVLDRCDNILLSGVWCHVEDLSIDLILNEKIMNPVCTYWHELYPRFSNEYHIVGWEDNGDSLLSPCDFVDITLLPGGPTEEYHVKNVTITLNVTIVGSPSVFYYFEYTGPFETMYWVKTHPICTYWMMIGGEHGMILHLEDWIDNCNGVLDYCDQIMLDRTLCHIEEVAIDIVLEPATHDVAVLSARSLYPSVYQGLVDPISVTVVNQGTYTETVDVYTFYAGNLAAPTQTVVLAPGGVAPLTFGWLTDGVPPGVYTISANATIAVDDDPGDNVLVGNQEQVVLPPLLYWKKAFRDYAPSGMPDFSQKQDAWENPPQSGKWSWCAPTAVANSLWWYDSKYEPNPIPPPTRIDNYPLVSSYNPGVWDDHDPQNVPWLISHLAYLMDTDGQRTIPGGGAAHFGTWVSDVQAGIAHYLSWTRVNPPGDVNGDGRVNQTDADIVTAAFGSVPGAGNWDMRADIWPATIGWPVPGVADNIVNANDLMLVTQNKNLTGAFYEVTVQAPRFPYVESEIERSEDVVLMLGFWFWTGTQWVRENYPYQYPSGHCVTAAGVNSTTMQIAISDPIQDNAEPPTQGNNGPGRVYPPPPHGHPGAPPDPVHNDASFVSHDIYNVAYVPPNFPAGMANFSLVGYASPQYPGQFMAVAEWAVTVSPLGVHDVAVTNITKIRTVIADNCTRPGHVHTYKVRVLNATIENQGNFTETFNVTAYADSIIIERKTVVNLAPGEKRTLTFSWNTTGVSKQNYTITVTADTVQNEIETWDNSLSDGKVRVVLPGNFNGDFIVNYLDIYTEGILRFMAEPGDPRYAANSDINDDDIINYGDIYTGNLHFMDEEP